MQSKWNSIDGSIVAPQGFLASGVFCDIKRLGTGKGSDKGQKRDLALIVSEVPATVAGMFTTNQVCAAPVKVCVARVAKGLAQAVVVNSGNANACTGRQGMADALEMTDMTEAALGLTTGRALVGSTGRIGVVLPMENVIKGITAAAEVLGSTEEHANQAAEAIMTSDSRPKTIGIEFKLGGKVVRIGGICKGAGMIQPGMSATGARPAALPQGLHATMLCFVTTDAAIDAKLLRVALKEAVANSFNRITVDGDMSTNDTVLVLANGLAGNKKIASAKDAGFLQFSAALQHVCLELAKKIVRDGEGVHRVVTVRLKGAKSDLEADSAARAVANSALVKTSWHGGDPNWGRIIDALGYSPATVKEDQVDIGYSEPGSKKVIWSLKKGQPTKVDYAALWKLVQPDEFDLHIHLHLGEGSAIIYAADLTEEYVDFNKGTVADPTKAGALGG
ncbi:MAG TPA: bifunctional glutamate N-acetyltransferase/amino-acid acetyltransferase ArgJ [Candidatus Limnocylindria bacterium]|nr:bifunctional glutamate N-acetyltransferase/amino-acid acetyltransferase ArgJ [Candidatus Limnocylindria bacterium]